MIIRRDLFRIFGKGNGQVRALDGVSLEISRGEFLRVISASGSGKSILLHLFGLLDRRISGRLSIGGVDVGTFDERGRTLFRLNRMGYVFQDYALISELTTEENVYLPSMVQGMTSLDCSWVCGEILSLAGLKNRIHHLPSDIPGGERQRVAIARALVNQPSIILADESCAYLDTQNSKIIPELNQEAEQRVKTDDSNSVPWKGYKKYFNRIIYMRDGKIVSDANQDGVTSPEIR